MDSVLKATSLTLRQDQIDYIDKISRIGNERSRWVRDAIDMRIKNERENTRRKADEQPDTAKGKADSSRGRH